MTRSDLFLLPINAPVWWHSVRFVFGGLLDDGSDRAYLMEIAADRAILWKLAPINELSAAAPEETQR